MHKNPNPQDKGTSPVLATLETQRAGLAYVPAKQIDQVTTELFTSLFVLDSEFRFKPVVGKRYFLYRKDTHFWLGLTPPDMLGEAVAGRFIGGCTLQRDLTWTIELDQAAAADDRFIAYLGQRRAQLESRLAAADTVNDVLRRSRWPVRSAGRCNTRVSVACPTIRLAGYSPTTQGMQGMQGMQAANALTGY